MKYPSHDTEPNDAMFYVFLSVIAFIVATLLWSMPSHCQTIEQRITKSALKRGVDPSLALSIAEVESNFDDSMVGTIGEIGIFQLRPEFHPVTKGRTQHNIDVAIDYLAKLRVECAEYGDAFFVCFNYGPTRKLKHPRLFPYYKKVKAAQMRRRKFPNVAARD